MVIQYQHIIMSTPTSSKNKNKRRLNQNSKNKIKKQKVQIANKARSDRLRGEDICCYHDCGAILTDLSPLEVVSIPAPGRNQVNLQWRKDIFASLQLEHDEKVKKRLCAKHFEKNCIIQRKSTRNNKTCYYSALINVSGRSQDVTYDSLPIPKEGRPTIGSPPSSDSWVIRQLKAAQTRLENRRNEDRTAQLTAADADMFSDLLEKRKKTIADEDAAVSEKKENQNIIKLMETRIQTLESNLEQALIPMFSWRNLCHYADNDFYRMTGVTSKEVYLQTLRTVASGCIYICGSLPLLHYSSTDQINFH